MEALTDFWDKLYSGEIISENRKHRLKQPFVTRKCLSWHSLRSKRFQSSYCAKVSNGVIARRFPMELLRESLSGSKKKVEGSFIPLPLPRHSFFFCSCPSFLDEPREETLATQAKANTSTNPRTVKRYEALVCRFFLFWSLYKTNRFHVAMGLFSNTEIKECVKMW